MRFIPLPPNPGDRTIDKLWQKWEFTQLTDGFRNGHNLCAVKRQITERPDDRVDLLHDVEGDGDDAASVLTHSHTSGRVTNNKSKFFTGWIQIEHCEWLRLSHKKNINLPSQLMVCWDWPWPCLVGLKQDEQCGLVVAVKELHVNNVQQLLVQLADVNDVAGQEAGFRPAGGKYTDSVVFSTARQL